MRADENIAHIYKALPHLTCSALEFISTDHQLTKKKKNKPKEENELKNLE